MKGKYKETLIWCSACDAEMVKPGSKCPNCKTREYGSKIKKPTMQEILNEESVNVEQVCEHTETYKKIRFGVELTKCKKCRKILSQT